MSPETPREVLQHIAALLAARCFAVTDFVLFFSPDDRRVASRARNGSLDSFAGINALRRQDSPITKLDPAKRPVFLRRVVAVSFFARRYVDR